MIQLLARNLCTESKYACLNPVKLCWLVNYPTCSRIVLELSLNLIPEARWCWLGLCMDFRLPPLKGNIDIGTQMFGTLWASMGNWKGKWSEPLPECCTKYLPRSTASQQIQTPVRCLDDFQCLLTSAFPKSSCGKGPKKVPVAHWCQANGRMAGWSPSVWCHGQ
jgi:hypothetical protein